MLPSCLTNRPRPAEAAALALLERIEAVAVSLPGLSEPIATTFVKDGAGEPPLLLLHGFDSSVLEYRRLLPLLAAHREVWAVDLLGFGFSERPERFDFSPRRIYEHLRAFWQQQIGRPVVLVGASMGGAAAIEFALACPEAVEKLVLIDSVGFAAGPEVGRFLVWPLDRMAAAFLASRSVRLKVGRNAYADARFATEDAWLCGAFHLQMPNWAEAIIAFTRSGGYKPFGERLGSLTAPTLILWGEQDRILDTADARRFEQAIPDAKLVWIANCGHVPHLERPHVTAEQILAFIG